MFLLTPIYYSNIPIRLGNYLLQCDFKTNTACTINPPIIFAQSSINFFSNKALSIEIPFLDPYTYLDIILLPFHVASILKHKKILSSIENLF